MKATWIRLLKRAKGGRLKNSDICVSSRVSVWGDVILSLLLLLLQGVLAPAPLFSNMILIAREGARESPVNFLSSFSYVVIYCHRRYSGQGFSVDRFC